MNPLTVSEVLARTSAALISSNVDVTGVLAALLTGANESLPADAAAVLVESGGTLEVLASTSHRADYIELHQMQTGEGPCVDVIEASRTISACGTEKIVSRWPTTGAAIVKAGYTCVQAVPLSWQGHTFGGLNLFRTDSTGFEPVQAECQALADTITLILVAGHLSADSLGDGLQEALHERAVIEQAKGAVAHVRSLDMAAAFDELQEMARARGMTLGVAAREVMQQAREGVLGRQP